jgi:hypothetical protein
MEGYYLSDANAWEIIATALESGCVYTEIAMNKPLGANAIVFTTPLPRNDCSVYVKIQIGAGNKPIGRSFHFSDLQESRKI